jgi:beta-N-acetylhexosaminidase
MEAAAVLARSGVAAAAERSVRAGADLILMTGSASWNEVFPRLLRRARSSPAFRARVRESAARVLALKSVLGLRPPRAP